MNTPDYVYVTYIASTPERIWEAITTPKLTKQFWFNHRNVSDWKTGSPWRHEDYDDANVVDVIGEVVESEPPHRLVLSWTDPDDAHDESKSAQVSIEITPDRGVVRVQITHTKLSPERLAGISFGWPLVLSNMKTLLETGKTLLAPIERTC